MRLWDAYRTWLLAQRPAGARPTRPTSPAADCVRFETASAAAEARLWEVGGAEVCELTIEREDSAEQPFYLHFVLDDLGRARALFREMAEVLGADAAPEVRRVLLTCTAGMTTTLLAHRMGEVARTLALAYEFSALPLTDAAAAEDGTYAAILVAPQTSSALPLLAHLHPTIPVFEIPPRIFGSYDAAAAVRLVVRALDEETPPQTAPRHLRDVRASHRILVVALREDQAGPGIAYRLFERGEAVLEGHIRLERIALADVDALLETVSARGVDLPSIDAVGIAVPGPARDGHVLLPGAPAPVDLAGHLAERFKISAHVDRDCNAAAVGCYVTQDAYESVSLFRQGLGRPTGGLGTIVAGRLLTGRLGLAGEPRQLLGRISYPGGYDEALRSAGGMRRIAMDVALACIATIAPDALYLAVETLEDTGPLRRALAADLGEPYVPDLFVVDDYAKMVCLGEMALLEQRLQGRRCLSAAVTP